jgi:MATE family multidrug resistance protein
MAKIAGPLVAAELGWMLQGVVDTMMVGRLPDSAAAIGGTAIANILFHTVAIFMGGVLLGMDPLVSQAFGAGRLKDCHRTLFASFGIVAPATVIVMGTVWAGLPLLRGFGVDARVMTQAEAFAGSLVWSTLPLLLYMALRHYLQCMNHVKIVMFALISANLVNWFFNWALIYGHMGLPAMGISGSGWSTVLARAYMAAVLFAYLVWIDKREHLRVFGQMKIELAQVRAILRYGLPTGLQIGLELAVFGMAAALIGKLGAVPLAAHQIAINVVATTYMVPLGIGAAAAVRVGQAIGRRDPRGAERSGWVAIAMGASFMAMCALALLVFPHAIARSFSDNETVVAAAVSLLFYGAMFQLFDGIQAVSAGALRGSGETRKPMVTFFISYWFVGLPLGYWLCFNAGWSARGLWTGFCVALTLVGCALLVIWEKKAKRFEEAAIAKEMVAD